MKDHYILKLETSNFVVTDYFKKLKEKSIAYLKAGIAVNLSGPSGIGKTSLALYVARELRRPVVFIHGNEDLLGSDLIGGNYGYHKRKMVDNFVHSVYLLEEDLEHRWAEGRLTAACTNGYTLVYDEYTRSRPEVNNFLLSVLEERMLSLTGLQKKNHYLEVHPEFKVIFTSNPREYAGVHKSQMALDDRIITLDIFEMDRDTKIAVTMARSGMVRDRARMVVDSLQRIKEKIGEGGNISVRSCIKIARILQHSGDKVDPREVYTDVLLSENRFLLLEKRADLAELIAGEIDPGVMVEETVTVAEDPVTDDALVGEAPEESGDIADDELMEDATGSETGEQENEPGGLAD
ncbi:gas vesicle protein GvpN [Desulfocucumis palustris]|uniref:Gas vesicle protein GvpN n=1 Tax=Desulfocucumis palustris TaxID=1898651 RepID=A0A2L2X8A8_9FIRM|nr:gas vesicle protein GvpN [Desulfocucumis palustris]GBF32439.1 gas vesicle protein GvpN [Desulfocucumis palustris]